MKRLTVAATSLLPVILVATLVLVPTAHAEGFYVRSVTTRLLDGVHMLDADIDFRLSEEALEALNHGVAIVALVKISVKQLRDYVWNKRVANLEQRYRMEYHALSKRYLLTNVNSGVNRAFARLEDALEAMGRIRGFPLLDHKLLEPELSYVGELKTGLDIEALPAPMRLPAYFSTSWRLTSNLYTWPLHP